ncbi:MAG TPA: ABC transporter permease [Clostridiaceae bacterium]|jgi:simple sugar transport system permease protein|nr:ABC transporter permease [Clostridiaceae bacterium]
MGNGLKKFARSQLVIPLFALFLLVVFNLIRDPEFFSLTIATNNQGNTVLSGNLISILNGASAVAILSIGMTLVTSSCKGQDISVAAVAAIAGSVFVSVLRSNEITIPIIILAFLFSCVVAVLFSTFNGVLVAVFKIQPMIATLILFSAGRSIAYWINGGATPTVSSPLLSSIGGFIPGIPLPTPIIIMVIFLILISLVLRFTNLGLYTQVVGINEGTAHLNGINPVWIKLISFMILGVCVATAGCITVCRIGLINHETLLLDVEMDVILAVAIGGTALSGGKFSLFGSVIGAYIIQALTVTLYAMKVPSAAVKAYKAMVIIIIVVISSPVVKAYAINLYNKLFKKQLQTENSNEGSLNSV